MNDRHVRGHVDSPVFFHGGKPEDVIVFVDGAAHRAERIVAVGERIGQGELFQPARLRGLNDSDVSDVVRNELVKGDLQLPGIPRAVVRLQNAAGYRTRLVALAARERAPRPYDRSGYFLHIPASRFPFLLLYMKTF